MQLLGLHYLDLHEPPNRDKYVGGLVRRLLDRRPHHYRDSGHMPSRTGADILNRMLSLPTQHLQQQHLDRTLLAVPYRQIQRLRRR